MHARPNGSTSAATALLLSLALATCGPAPRAAEPGPHPECAIAGEGVAGSMVVAVGGQVAPDNAPVPGGPAERVVFRQLYETLVRVDCTGRVLPGLATSWVSREDGRVWQFTLRPDARFWDGAPVTATAVAAGWAAIARSAAGTLFAAVGAPAERTLSVELREPSSDPRLFADPRLAVAQGAGRAGLTAAWPVGSGAFRPAPDSRGGAVVVQRNDEAQPGPRVVEFRTVAGDLRTALDAGVDLLITGDPAATQYARVLPDYEVIALRWSRTYVLVTSALPSVGRDTTPVAPPSAVLGARPDLRDAAPPFWWRHAHCRVAPAASAATAPAAAPAAREILYQQGDATARDIAERVAALAWPAARTPAWLAALLPEPAAAGTTPVVAARGPRDLAASLQSGGALAVVLALPRTATGDCPAPWLVQDPALHALLLRGAWRIAPLLDARDYVIRRRATPGFVVDDGGVPDFAGGRR